MAEPLPALLKRLREARGLSQEALAFRVYDAGEKMTAGAIGQFERGVTRPLPSTVEKLAIALEVDPSVFPEYRLAVARRQLDEREVGLDEALRNLAALQPGVGEAVDGEPAPPAPPERLRRELEDAPPSRRSPDRQANGAAAKRRRPA